MPQVEVPLSPATFQTYSNRPAFSLGGMLWKPRLCAGFLRNFALQLTPTLCIPGGGHFGRFYPYGDLTRHRMIFQKMDRYQCNGQCIYDAVRCVQEISCDDVGLETRRMMDEVVLPARESLFEESARTVQ